MARNRFVKVNIDRLTRPIPLGEYALPVVIGADGDVPFVKLSSLKEALDFFDVEDATYAALKAMFDQRDRNDDIAVVSYDEGTGSLTELLDGDNPTQDGYLITTSLLDDDSIKQIGAWAASKDVIFLPTTDSIELAEEMALTGTTYENTLLSVHDKQEQYMGARAAALASGHFFGTFWLKFKGLVGLELTDFSTNDISRIHAANSITYIYESGIAMVSDTKLVGGEYMDIIQTEHYLVSEITNRIFNLLTTHKKIPYTDSGIDTIHGGLIAVLEDASKEERGVLARDENDNPTYKTSAPRRKDIDLSFVTNRVLPDVKFTAIPTGAIGEVIINGVLTFEM